MGLDVGAPVGFTVGFDVGFTLGFNVGVVVTGDGVGAFDGCRVGELLGAFEGCRVGELLGAPVTGESVGAADGDEVGLLVTSVGLVVGVPVVGELVKCRGFTQASVDFCHHVTSLNAFKLCPGYDKDNDAALSPACTDAGPTDTFATKMRTLAKSETF